MTWCDSDTAFWSQHKHPGGSSHDTVFWTRGVEFIDENGGGPGGGYESGTKRKA